MDLISGMRGNASEVGAERLGKEISDLLPPGETVDRAFQLVRDLYVFTNKRLIFVDKQGMSGNKIEYHSIPYRAVTHFSIETAGRFDRDAELKIWISSTRDPIEITFKKGSSILDVHRTLAQHVLG